MRVLSKAESVQRLLLKIQEKRIEKKEIGNALGSKGNTHAKIQMANKFLDPNGKLVVGDVVKVAELLREDPVFFLYEIPNHLSSGELPPLEPKGETEIRSGLRKMGFDEAFIEAQMVQLRNMQSYRNRS